MIKITEFDNYTKSLKEFLIKAQFGQDDSKSLKSTKMYITDGHMDRQILIVKKALL